MLAQSSITFPNFEKDPAKLLILELQQRLRMLQLACYMLKIPVLIIIDGFDFSGRTDVVKILSEKMDPRGYRVYPILDRVVEEYLYPFMWKYWKIIPENGNIAVYLSSYYSELINARFFKKIKSKQLENYLDECKKFEQQLTTNNLLLVKLFLYIDHAEQNHRLKKLSSKKSTSWSISNNQYLINKKYERWYAIANEILAQTSYSFAPWSILYATNKKSTQIGALTLIKQKIESRVIIQEMSPDLIDSLNTGLPIKNNTGDFQ